MIGRKKFYPAVAGAVLLVAAALFSPVAASAETSVQSEVEKPETSFLGGFEEHEEGELKVEWPDGSSSTITASEPEPVSESDINEYGELKSQEGVKLADATASNIQSRSWTQQHTDTFGFFAVRHVGTFFFDGNGQVWSTTTQNGRTGSHSCSTRWTIPGVGLEHDSCNTVPRSDLSTPAISEYFYFTVSTAGFSFGGNYIHVNLYTSGTILYYETVGNQWG
ncbi:hypothetical protein [Natronoglycomyces albus]|uniref:Secreted protein n=1 Tax=Natronoglycomyces albus TaxID=2811108 RepID=A0A895XVA6_9ACTN|nr:hypothetical protein [Natronoglycomyces albus]QSB06456.1 hypothetical protein JQS30_06020 [Natronoglycomyces albus]